MVRLKGLGKLKKFSYVIGTRTSRIYATPPPPQCSIVIVNIVKAPGGDPLQVEICSGVEIDVVLPTFFVNVCGFSRSEWKEPERRRRMQDSLPSFTSSFCSPPVERNSKQQRESPTPSWSTRPSKIERSSFRFLQATCSAPTCGMCAVVSHYPWIMSLWEYYTGRFKKSFTTLKAYTNLFRGHAQCFKLP
jgi:hypothetical protein